MSGVVLHKLPSIRLRTNDEDSARVIALDENLYWGMSFLDGWWYVGTADDLDKICTADNIFPKARPEPERKHPVTTRMETPWGISQGVTRIGGDDSLILSVSTASHGGIFVPATLLERIPQKYQTWAAQWSGSKCWYEEDCCWACVAVSFPELFRAEDLTTAKKTLAHYFPEDFPS